MALRLTGATRENRFAMTARMEAALSAAGAWIVSHQQFANAALCIGFEVGREKVPRLVEELGALGFQVASGVGGDDGDPVMGTVQVTFLHEEPDIPVELPLG